MHITTSHFRALAADVDEMHRQNMKTFADETRELHRTLYRSRRSGSGADDQAIAGYAQSVELAAVAAYAAAAPVLSAGTLPVAQLFMTHHQQHADAFGAVAGAKAVTAPNKTLVAAVTPMLQAIKDEKGALEFAFVLEGQAAYTYAAALTLLQDPAYAAATATILPIEAQHQVVLGLALGKDVTAVFPTGAFESASLGDGTDPLKGLDPAVFVV
ncbi:MAG TPA: ferritin-like domain-containing protein [Ilumatobacteraceae bacterium]|nr:ferritin-like domain-containing protein [Ilumatobacteraceae bacterium]